MWVCRGKPSGKYECWTRKRKKVTKKKAKPKNKINTTNNRASCGRVGGLWGLRRRKWKKMRMEYVNARTLKWNEGKKRETITSTETFVFYCCTITRDEDDNRQTWQWHTNRQHFTLRWNFVVSVMRRHSIGNILRSRANAAEQMIQSNNNINNDSSFGKQPNERTNESKLSSHTSRPR